MHQYLTELSPSNIHFPDVEHALNEPNGLLAIGGDLSCQRIAQAYRSGIFPWYSDGDPIMWWSPNPRAVIQTHQLKINKTLKKVIKRQQFSISINKAFHQVIDYCADAPFREDGTWILDEMKQAYCQLHQQGIAHSIEVWQEETLVGGLYGIAINGFFSGESMFYLTSNASKIALVALSQHLKTLGITFIDCQIINPFLASMGAADIKREAFFEQQRQALKVKVPSDFWQAQTLVLKGV